MKMYLSAFRIQFINGIQYRAVVLFEIIARLGWGLMEILAFAAFYRAAPEAFPMTLQQTVSYVWIRQTCLILFSVVFADADISSAIETGSIAYDLVRPMDLYGRWFSRAAASRISHTLLYGMPALLIALIIPEPYRLALPADFLTLGLFLVSTALALSVVVSFAMLMYVTMFYTLSHRGVRIIVTALTSFLSGGVIPLPFFPAPVLRIVELLPFAAMQNMPLRIYNGDIAGLDALGGIGFQCLWLAALVLLGKLLMRRAIGRVVVQGG